MVSVQCTVSIPDTVGADTAIIPVALGFYHQPTHTKFDVLLTIEGDRLSYSQFVYFYGSIKEHHLTDTIQLTLLHKYQPIRRLVAAVVDMIDNQ